MAYTRAWSDTTPQDTDQASTLGAVTRNLRLDIHERMNTILGASQWEADPVGGLPVTKLLYIPPIVGYPSPSASDDTNTWFMNFAGAGDTYSIKAPGAVSDNTWNVPLVLPIGATLTKVRAGFSGSGIITASVTGVYVANKLTPSTLTSIGSNAGISGTTAFAWYDCSVTSHEVIAGDQFLVIIAGNSGTGSALYYGLEVTYTIPNLLVGY